MNLIEYGILAEKSHLRAHVCVVAGKVYMYTPENGRKAIATGKWPTRLTCPRYAGYTPTANGYIVPPNAIEKCQCYDVRSLIDMEQFSPKDNTTIKGKKAQNVVVNMARLGLFCWPGEPEIITDIAEQIAGTDLLIAGIFRVQVKCDYNGGEHPQATGSLYLQISERNLGFI